MKLTIRLLITFDNFHHAILFPVLYKMADLDSDGIVIFSTPFTRRVKPHSTNHKATLHVGSASDPSYAEFESNLRVCEREERWKRKGSIQRVSREISGKYFYH